MTKPVVFFSHSSKDGEALGRLKARFTDLTGGTVDVFLSSDGQSIRLGSNWLASVERALEQASLMFVFVSPRAVGSPWLYFESGHAYAKKLDVVPVGLFGTDIGKLPPPLSILQGFNVTNHESLNNIIAKVNEKFAYAHRLGFLPEDFQSLEQAGPVEMARILGAHAESIKSIDLSARSADIDEQRFATLLSAIDVPKMFDGLSCSVAGARISLLKSVSDSQPPRFGLHATIDPWLAHVALPIAEQVFQRCDGLRETGSDLGYSLSIDFASYIDFIATPHVMMGRLLGSKAMLDPKRANQNSEACFRFGDLRFRLEPRRNELVLNCVGESFARADIRGLLDLLFDAGVLAYSSL